LACLTLAKAIDALGKIDGDSINPSTVRGDIDFASMERFLLQVFDTRRKHASLTTPSLVLLRATIRKYTNATTSLGSKLIMGPGRGGFAGSNDRCKHCSKRHGELGGFLACVHIPASTEWNIDPETANLARGALAGFVKTMPWKTWLPPLNHDRPRTISGFRQRVVRSLETVMDITRCDVLHREDSCADSVGQLAICIFTEIPFCEDKLVRAGVDLWSTFAKVSVSRNSTPKVQEVAVSVLVTCMGGRVTPQGELLPMCAPARA
jgi:hypothetical protein